MKKVSRFEYEIDKYINENIKPVDMDNITCLSADDEQKQRVEYLESSAFKLLSRIKTK